MSYESLFRSRDAQRQSSEFATQGQRRRRSPRVAARARDRRRNDSRATHAAELERLAGAQSFEIDCGLDPSDTPAIADAIHNLILDITELERAAALSPAGSLEREELSAAACFLSCVGRAVAYLPGAAIAS